LLIQINNINNQYDFKPNFFIKMIRKLSFNSFKLRKRKKKEPPPSLYWENVTHEVAKEHYFGRDAQEGDKYNFFMDGLNFVRYGFQVICDDAFNRCFQPNKVPAWNFTPFLFFMWSIGVFIRHFILFPIKTCILIFTVTFFPLFLCLLKLLPNTRSRRYFEVGVAMLT
jgi:hypothetical protein